jgi:hypothetical protein
LRLDRIFRRTEELFDTKMLLDPLHPWQTNFRGKLTPVPPNDMLQSNFTPKPACTIAQGTINLCMT